MYKKINTLSFFKSSVLKVLVPHYFLFYFVGYLFSKFLKKYFLLIILRYNSTKEKKNTSMAIYWMLFCQLTILVGVLLLITCINKILILPFLIGFLFSSMLNFLPNETFKLKKRNTPKG